MHPDSATPPPPPAAESGVRSELLLLAASALVFFVMLGSSPLWTQEGRWGAICMEMERSGDWLHPRLLGEPYYDKPLPSYWLMLVFAKVLGLNEWSLRLPGALAGLLTVWCVCRLGRRLFDRATGLLAGWMLLGCGAFVFWARLACADMLNIAAITAAVAWYFERRGRPGFGTYAVFWMILAAGALMKGLVAPAVAVVALLPDLVRGGAWRRHLRFGLVFGAIPALTLYAAPFLVSGVHGNAPYAGNGLEMVFRENVLRYFRPFDHQDPWWIYFKYLPLYLLPWTFLLPFAARDLWRERRSMPEGARWAAWACALIYLFMTASGSRRNYYILPILPFLILLLAGWARGSGAERVRIVRGTAAACWALAVVWFGAVVPLAFAAGGPRRLGEDVRAAAAARAPWGEWQVVVCSGPPSAAYYCRPATQAVRMNALDPAAVSEFVRAHPRTVVITRAEYDDQIRPLLPGATEIREQSRIPAGWRSAGAKQDALVAFVPP